MFTETIDVMRARGIKRAGPYRVTQIMRVQFQPVLLRHLRLRVLTMPLPLHALLVLTVLVMRQTYPTR